MIKFNLKPTKSEILIQKLNYVRSGSKAWKEDDDERLRGAAIPVLMCSSSS